MLQHHELPFIKPGFKLRESHWTIRSILRGVFPGPNKFYRLTNLFGNVHGFDNIIDVQSPAKATTNECMYSALHFQEQIPFVSAHRYCRCRLLYWVPVLKSISPLYRPAPAQCNSLLPTDDVLPSVFHKMLQQYFRVRGLSESTEPIFLSITPSSFESARK